MVVCDVRWHILGLKQTTREFGREFICAEFLTASRSFGMVRGQRNHTSGPGCGALGFGGFADEEAEGAVGGFADADAWGGQNFGGMVAVVGDLDGGGG